jgi:hypothetical protein
LKFKLGIKAGLIDPVEMKRAMIKSAVVVANDAKLLCPVDTGRLRASITWAMNDFQSPVGVAAAGPPKDGEKAKLPVQPTADDRLPMPTKPMYAKIGTNVEYAQFVEYMKGGSLSFLRRAFIQNFGRIREIFAAALKRSIEK